MRQSGWEGAWVKAEAAQNAGRLPFGLPGVNKANEIGNANYLWISYFYAYLNETGRAGFVMASSATDSQGKDKDIREQLVKTGHVDVMISVGNNFFYTKSLPCSTTLIPLVGRRPQLPGDRPAHGPASASPRFPALYLG